MPLTPEQQKIADEVFAAIRDRAPRFIYMPRRGGKTIILRAVEERIKEYQKEMIR